jgi:hypothetical protein
MSANNYAKLDDYGLRYLPVHLAESGEVAELFALMNADFCEALRVATKTDLLFTGHLSLARSLAFKQGKNQLPEVFRMMFMEVNLRSAVDSISPETLMFL